MITFQSIKVIRRVATLLCFALLITAFSPAASASAASTTNNNNVSSQEEIITSESTQKFADDMKFLFEVASKKQSGKINIDKEKIAERFGSEAVPSLSAFIKIGYGEDLTASDLKNVPTPSSFGASNSGLYHTNSWFSCVKGKVLDATGIGFLTGGMATLISKKKWVELGLKIMKIAGKNAIKGGIVGFAASMAWYSATCVGK